MTLSSLFRALRSTATGPLTLAASLAFAGPLGCAHAPPPPPAPLPPRPEYRSSVAAVLAHRDELGLTEDQARELNALEDKQQEMNAELRPEGSQQSGQAGAKAAPRERDSGSGRDA